jgi:uncharacterized protein YegP (UPF0339 family)
MTPSRSVFASLLGLGLMLGTPAAGTATTTEPRPSAWPEVAGGASDDAAKSLTFETYRDQKEEHRWRLKATNGQIIATSGQGYKDKRDCEHAIDVIKKGAETAKVEEAK